MNDHVVFFNNCRGRDHRKLFGPDAFFDLDVTGRQAGQAKDLPMGQDCVVASYGVDGAIEFHWHVLDREEICRDDRGTPCRVLFGECLSTESLSKRAAARSRRYSAFFDIRGHFKQSAVINGTVDSRDRVYDGAGKRTLNPDEVDTAGQTFVEGATRPVTVNAFERNAAARRVCLEKFGTACWICGFDFGKTYGPEATDYIHVHHLKPLAEIKASYEIDPIRDLRPVCPNCHAVLHLKGKLRSVAKVKAMLRAAARRTK